MATNDSYEGIVSMMPRAKTNKESSPMTGVCKGCQGMPPTHQSLLPSSSE